MRYRNISDHLEDLTGGRAVDPGKYVELNKKDTEDEYNAAKIKAGVFIEAPETKNTTNSEGGK